MFGIGFTELLLISIIAILFVGPDKLPGAIVEIGKFIKSVKKTISETKNSLEEEMKLADLKTEALSYKQQLDDATQDLKNFKNIDFDDDDISYDTEVSTKEFKPTPNGKEAVKETVTTTVEPQNETVTLSKPTKQEEPIPTPTKKEEK